MELNFESEIFIIDSLCGAIFIVAALIMIKFPPKSVNSLYGYRTGRSMKNQENWDFAQKYSSKKMMLWGIILLAISPLGLLFKLNQHLEVVIGISLMILAISIPIYMTEKELKKIEKINEKSNRN